jgi:hypothetical protein
MSFCWDAAAQLIMVYPCEMYPWMHSPECARLCLAASVPLLASSGGGSSAPAGAGTEATSRPIIDESVEVASRLSSSSARSRAARSPEPAAPRLEAPGGVVHQDGMYKCIAGPCNVRKAPRGGCLGMSLCLSLCCAVLRRMNTAVCCYRHTILVYYSNAQSPH